MLCATVVAVIFFNVMIKGTYSTPYKRANSTFYTLVA
jgi:hypothetical protein